MIHDYIASDGAHCPFCNSLDIESGRLDADGDSAWAAVKCAIGGQEWQDVFFLGAIDVIAEDCSITTVMPETEA